MIFHSITTFEILLILNTFQLHARFDEMKVSVLAELDQRLECLSGPSDNAFLLTIRGLVADWYYPFYTAMDYSLNKESYQSIISELYMIKLTVLLSVCEPISSVIFATNPSAKRFTNARE